MSFGAELLDLAFKLAESRTSQAGLRRAVSTAYYALFHRLIDDAVANWTIERQRSDLARAFEHGRMKAVCKNLVDKKPRTDPEALIAVANNFIKLRDHRERADYVNSVVWTPAQVDEVLLLASEAFVEWDLVHTKPEAEDFLLHMLVKPRA